MEIIKYPQREQWKAIMERPYTDNGAVLDTVRHVLREVRRNGDAALLELARRFDGAELAKLEADAVEIQSAEAALAPSLKTAIRAAAANIEAFHRGQLREEAAVETAPGIRCWRRSVGIERVGLYIPGGSAPLFSTVLMLGIPARLAGCAEVVLCTPPGKDGKVHPAILYAASLCGISRVVKAGGAGAIAALAYGTDTIPRVDKIFGPGNQYVTAAKQLVQQEGVAIDMPAGPSEVCVLADAAAQAAYIAADLLSQAEHGPDSQVLLLTDSEALIVNVEAELECQVAALPRGTIARKALERSRIVLLRSLDEAMELANAYAAEHLILQCADAEARAEQVRNAGSVFIGAWSPESAGDYATGTNHTLPTNGFARASSGVSTDSFVRKITFQQLTREGLQGIAATVTEMAEAEGLQAHAEAVRVRLR
ncbi:histidinol dehydrogenase [Flaviaesturariibacter aridisoli]|uniref:Histidinol dehydrogenase n=1 Tax=Flaviaesturariibacter aridisoli TaxID=2545761 RepID=A0A4R4DX65_9BACT|nr:histidinol dehydrogenase [Flaviaesturariibacter aridisoli]TCZ69075.1 histidinol dehydrogenase [Flaviaesturariibacter aridisoli]